MPAKGAVGSSPFLLGLVRKEGTPNRARGGKVVVSDNAVLQPLSEAQVQSERMISARKTLMAERYGVFA